MYQNLLNQETSTGVGFAQALGLAAAPEAAATVGANASIEQDYLRDVGASEKSLASELGTAISEEGALAQGRTRSAYDEMLADIFGQRRDIQSQRGNELIGARQDAIRMANEQQALRAEMGSNRLKDTLAIRNQQIAEAMLPVEKRKALADLRSQGISDAYTQARIADLMSPEPTKPTGWQAENLDKDALMGTALNLVRTPHGQWRTPLNQSWTRVKSYLSSIGLNPNTPRGKAWLRSFANVSGIKLGPRGNPIGRRPGAKRKLTPAEEKARLEKEAGI